MQDFYYLIYHISLSEYYFFFLLPITVEKELFSGQIFEIEFLMELHFLRAPESESYALSGWCVCISMYVLSVQHNNR